MTGGGGNNGVYLPTNGVMTTNPTSNTANGDPIQVNLSYDGSNNLVETLTDLTTSATWSNTYSVGSLAATVGGKTAYLGFTGADGGATSTQTISNFSIVTSGGTNVLPTTTPVTIRNGATLDLTDVTQTIASLSSTDGKGSKVLLGDGTLTVGDATNTVFDGAISGQGGSLVKQGAGTLVLSGADTYTGGTTVNAGTLTVTNGTAIADGSSLSVGAGGTFIFDPLAAGAPVAAGSVASGAAAAVPEPGTLALLLAGAVAALAVWRRRR